MTYADKLLDPKWQKKRLTILDRDNWRCKLCRDSEATLHIHHLSYSKGNPWDVADDQLITLCKHCHAVVEFNKKYKVHETIKILKREFTDGVFGLTFIYLDEDNELTIDLYNYTKSNELNYLTSMNQDHLHDISENIEYYYIKAEAP